MALSGTLRTWNDDRGFGFIAPRGGGRELFVHISAFPRDGSRPTVGETLSYELGTGNDGRPQAVRVFRQALGRSQQYPTSAPHADRPRSWAPALVGTLIVAILGTYGYRAYQDRVALAHTAPADAAPTQAAANAESIEAFRCDGRTHCSQMTSCTEAKFFLRNCPGTQMDGNNDGVPCEHQWCTSPLAR